MENDVNHQELESLIHGELSQLGERQAPETLIPRVMEVIQARSQKQQWWRNPWTDWPRALQIASLPVLAMNAALVTAALYVLWRFPGSTWSAPQLQEKFRFLSFMWEIVLTLGNALYLIGKDIGTHWILAAATVIGMMYLACIGIGTLFVRMVLPKR